MRGATYDAVDLTTSRRRRPSARCTAARHAVGRKTSRRCSTCPPWIACDPRGSRKQPSQAADRRSAAAGGLQADLARAATTHRPKKVSSPRYSHRALRRAMIKAFGSRPPHCRCRREDLHRRPTAPPAPPSFWPAASFAHRCCSGRRGSPPAGAMGASGSGVSPATAAASRRAASNARMRLARSRAPYGGLPFLHTTDPQRGVLFINRQRLPPGKPWRGG